MSVPICQDCGQLLEDCDCGPDPIAATYWDDEDKMTISYGDIEVDWETIAAESGKFSNNNSGGDEEDRDTEDILLEWLAEIIQEDSVKDAKITKEIGDKNDIRDITIKGLCGGEGNARFSIEIEKIGVHEL